MRKGMIFSAMLHAAVVALALFGLPDLWRREEISSQPIPVELVDIGELTNAPPPQAEQQTEERAERAELKPAVRPAPPPPPEPEEPQLAAPVVPPKPTEEAKKPEPEPKPKEEAKQPEPEPKPEPEPEKPVAQQAQTTERPKRRPKPPQRDFDSVLKTVESLKKEQEARETPEPQRQTASATNARSIPDQPLTISELDAIRRQFISCWNVDVGAPGIENMMVSVRVELNADRTVRQAQLMDAGGSLSNSHYRSFAESALRAVRNPRCSPVKLPPKKFEAMKTFTLRFSAKEMLGL